MNINNSALNALDALKVSGAFCQSQGRKGKNFREDVNFTDFQKKRMIDEV